MLHVSKKIVPSIIFSSLQNNGFTSTVIRLVVLLFNCPLSVYSSFGKLIAERAKKIGVEHVAFDRGGFQYHGRIKALAEAAREAGLKF